MKIKSRHDILSDIIREAQQYPTGWKAAFGHDHERFSTDCYLFHPDIGIYLVKEYHKNPMTVQGLGTKIARHIDDDIEEHFTKKSGDFGIIQGNISTILSNIKRGIPAHEILHGALHGKDLGLQIPVRGHASVSTDTYEFLANTFSSRQQKLTTTFEKMVRDDGIYTSYG